MLSSVMRYFIDLVVVETSAQAINHMPIMASMDDAIAMCIHADDIPVLRRAYELVGSPNDSNNDERVRRMHCLLPFGDQEQKFGLAFTASGNKPALIFAPKYARKFELASVIPTAPRALSERLLIEGMKQFKVASQMALLVQFSRLIGEYVDFDQRSLVYHFPWLTGVIETALPRWKVRVDDARSRWENSARSDKKRRRIEFMNIHREYNEACAFASLAPSAQYAAVLPMALRPYVQPTADAAAMFHIMRRTIASTTPPESPVHVCFCAHHLFSPVFGNIDHSSLYGIGTISSLHGNEAS